MDNGIHFISGLPRSGSTLLAAILRQNPKLHANMTSPVAFFVNSVYAAMGAQNEMSVFINDRQREAVMAGVFSGFYVDIHKQKTVIDTNRIWCAKLPMLHALFPQAKVIACVRQPAWIMDSFERVHQQNPMQMSKMFNLDNGNTVYARADALGGLHGVVGLPWHALREAYFGAHRDKLILVEYEALTRDPKGTIEFVYDKLGFPRFDHDYRNIEYGEADEFDSRLGAPGLHSIRREVKYVERKTILPPDLFLRHSKDDFWRTPEAQAFGVTAKLWK